ncbi:MAG: hypothetical protein JST43_09395 [Bacteroidetes bacterium]|nr:hypothetical protein [Bacteroidota bacterium]MBS1539062.1 hypothetical protein [Bacteroidota bacterium]
MQRLIFDSHPAFILVCLLAGWGYAHLLYKSHHTWGKRTNRILFVLRFLVVAFLSFLLVGPVLKLITNRHEKPVIAVVVDNSISLIGKIDSIKILNELTSAKKQWQEAGYEVAWRNLAGKEVDRIALTNNTSDLSSALRSVVNEFEGKNLARIVLLSDGVYNSGASPLFTTWRVPVTTVGLGDTIEHADLVLKNIAYNKIAYQGNQFPVRAEVAVQKMPEQDVTVSIFKEGVRIQQQKKNSAHQSLVDFNFLIEAKEKGIQRLEVVVESTAGEFNLKNNRTSIYVEVVEGKKKILAIAPAPHPDLKALRSVVEKNPNYEFIVHIPGISKTDPSLLQPNQTELVIFHNPADYGMKTNALLAQLSKGRSSVLLIIGSNSNLRQLPAVGIPFSFPNVAQTDEVSPVANPSFTGFELAENSNSIFSFYPPVPVPLGKFSFPPQAQVLLHQRIGSVATDRPLLLFWNEGSKKMAAFVGENFWRWRMEEFSRTEKAEVFDDLFSKTIQYLSTLDDKRKFKFFPVQSEFNENAPVVFEGQVYNDLFEKIYGHKIDITLRDPKGKITSYNYILGRGGERYTLGGLSEGVYHYSATATINGKKESVSGQFLVVAQSIELQNLVADHSLLRKLAQSTGGKFYNQSVWNNLASEFANNKAADVIHSEETFQPLVHAKWFFFLLMVFISSEWFLRKYLGSY